MITLANGKAYHRSLDVTDIGRARPFCTKFNTRAGRA
jgi:hypothetical protein